MGELWPKKIGVPTIKIAVTPDINMMKMVGTLIFFGP